MSFIEKRLWIYGTKVPRIWYDLLPRELLGIGLKSTVGAPCLFSGDDVLTVVYVDDLFVMSSSHAKPKEVKKSLYHKLPARD